MSRSLNYEVDMKFVRIMRKGFFFGDLKVMLVFLQVFCGRTSW